jgi:hypothetical protein
MDLGTIIQEAGSVERSENAQFHLEGYPGMTRVDHGDRVCKCCRYHDTTPDHLQGTANQHSMDPSPQVSQLAVLDQ